MPASSDLYDRLEAVSAWVPVRGLILGERPMSRRDFQRAIDLIGKALDSNKVDGPRRDWARRELRAMRAALGAREGVARQGSLVSGITWRGETWHSSAELRRIQPNGLGGLDTATGFLVGIDALESPFAGARHGWPDQKGTFVSLSPTLLLGIDNGIAVVAQPLASVTSVDKGGWRSDRLFNRAYARLVFLNAAVQVGADEARWGQSPHGAMFISGNSLPLPALRVGTDTPVTLPWLFRLAGPVRASFLISDLGQGQDPPHTKLAAWQASIQPWSRFEIAVAVAAQQGGEGGPEATLFERFVDLLPVIDALAPQRADLQFSNKLAGGNLRLRFPELSGLDFYYELQIDDFDGRRLRSSLVEDAGHLLGLRLPLLWRDGLLSWRAEWHRTSLRLYEHAQFRSGYSYRQRMIGNPLGPNAKAGYLAVEWRPSPGQLLALSLSDQSRDPSLYTVVVSGAFDRGFSFRRIGDDPRVRRRQVAATVAQAIPGGLLRATIAYNRGWRTGQPGRDEWLTQFVLSSRALPAF